MKELTIKITGEAGQGMQTIGLVLCRIFKKLGLYIYANQDYMSRVRGGNNFFQLRISGNPIYSLVQKADITVALDKKSVGLHKADIAANGIMVLDKIKFDISENQDVFFNVAFYEMANKSGGSDIYVNSVCCGIILVLTGVSFDYLEQAIKDIFADKGEEIISKNISASKAGYNFTKDY